MALTFQCISVEDHGCKPSDLKSTMNKSCESERMSSRSNPILRFSEGESFMIQEHPDQTMKKIYYKIQILLLFLIIGYIF